MAGVGVQLEGQAARGMGMADITGGQSISAFFGDTVLLRSDRTKYAGYRDDAVVVDALAAVNFVVQDGVLSLVCGTQTGVEALVRRAGRAPVVRSVADALCAAHGVCAETAVRHTCVTHLADYMGGGLPPHNASLAGVVEYADLRAARAAFAADGAAFAVLEVVARSGGFGAHVVPVPIAFDGVIERPLPNVLASVRLSALPLRDLLNGGGTHTVACSAHEGLNACDLGCGDGKHTARKVLCDKCGFMVNPEGHEERCRVVAPEAEKAAAQFGDVVHRLDVLAALEFRKVPQSERTIEMNKLVSGEAQSAWYRQHRGHAVGSLKELSREFERTYFKFRDEYLSTALRDVPAGVYPAWNSATLGGSLANYFRRDVLANAQLSLQNLRLGSESADSSSSCSEASTTVRARPEVKPRVPTGGYAQTTRGAVLREAAAALRVPPGGGGLPKAEVEARRRCLRNARSYIEAGDDLCEYGLTSESIQAALRAWGKVYRSVQM